MLSTQLTISAGDTAASLPVTCNLDQIEDPDEIFTASLSDPSGASLGITTATIQITDNNGRYARYLFEMYKHVRITSTVVTVSFDPTSYVVEEGDEVLLRVVLNIPSTSDITVMLDTSDGTAEGIYYSMYDISIIKFLFTHLHTAPGDYDSVSTELTIPAGDIDISFPVTCNIDDIDDPDEVFSATLSDPSGANLGVDTATIAITDINGVFRFIPHSR